jgi:hypothetical protein
MVTAPPFTQVMYDCTHANIPRLLDRTPFAIGGYVTPGSAYAWTPADWRKFPHSYHVRINESHDHTVGNCVAVEFDAASVADIVPWATHQMAHIVDPLLIYCNRSNLDACLAERAKLPHWEGRVFMWVATLDGTLVYDRAMTQFGQLHDDHGTYADVSVIRSHNLRELMQTRIGHQIVA